MFWEEAIQQPGEKELLLRDGIMESLHVALPCEVISFNADDQTIKAQPLIRGWNDTEKPPVLVDVPVFFPFGYSFDVNAGDECLVVFSDSCIDGWFQNGGIASPLVARKHDLSDGFAFVGFRSKKKAGNTVNLSEKLAEIERRLSTLEG